MRLAVANDYRSSLNTSRVVDAFAMALQVPRLDPCPFCAYLAGVEPCAFLHRGKTVSAFLNRTQYERGALLVVSNAHVESALHADAQLTGDMHREARRLAELSLHDSAQPE
jgi:hypothetical protein